MKKILFLFCILFLASNVTFSTEEFAEFAQAPLNFADYIKKERATVSNALQLSEEQAKQREQLTKANNSLLNDKFQNFYHENTKLRILKLQNASAEVIKEQEEIVYCAKKEIQDIIKQENKDFKKILDRDQRAKLSMIQKIQRKEIKASKNKKDFYKSNPKMRKFSPQKNCY